MKITNRVIRAIPATKVLANVYQLYMVLYQCASTLINQSHGIEDMTVNAKTTIKIAAQTVLFQIYFFPSSIEARGLSSMLRESFLIFQPNNDHATMVKMVQPVKKVLFRKP